MREIRKRERVVPELGDQVMAFVRTALPPLIARYALTWVRAAMALPQVRALMLVLIGLVLAVLFVPALLIGVLAFLATGSAVTASVAAVTVTVLAGVVLGVLLARLWTRWKAFRLRHFGIR